MKTKYNKELSIKRTGTGSYLITEKPKQKITLFEKFYDFMSNFIFGGKRTALALIILISLNIHGQETKISAMAGYKSFELGFTYLDEETEIIYGVSASVIDAKFSESIANFHDTSKHDFKGDVVPAMHFLIGSKFDRLSFIGKIGAASINQNINDKKEPQNIYLSYGLMVGYEFENRLSFVGSIDAVNAIMCGVQFKL